MWNNLKSTILEDCCLSLGNGDRVRGVFTGNRDRDEVQGVIIIGGFASGLLSFSKKK